WRQGSYLWFLSSTDGKFSDKNKTPTRISPVGNLVTVTDCTSGCALLSTSSFTLSSPYALVIPGQPYPRLIWQWRNTGGVSQVSVGDLAADQLGNPLGDVNTGKFLPGSG